MPVKSLKPDKKILRIFILLLALAGLTFFGFSFKWYLANTISAKSQYKDLAALSVTLAPDDPQTHFSLAVLLEKTFLPEDLEESLSEYQKTVELTPNNYLALLDLGKAYEHTGNQDLAEKSFIRAEELAPNYAYVKWNYGNFLLRSGNTIKGIEKIKIAAETNEDYLTSFFSISWQLFDNDIEKIKLIVGDSVKLQSAFAVFLARQKKFDESINIWKSLPADKKQTTLKADGEAIYSQLLNGKRFLQALEIQSQINEVVSFEIGKISNGSFETEIQTKNDNIFDWSIEDGFQPVIGIDAQEKEDGARSLVYIFNSDDGKEYRNVTHTVAVKSGSKYKLQFFYKSNLKTKSTIKCDVINAFDGTLITESNSIKAISDWTSETVVFTVPENTQGIVLRITRGVCQSSICAITGKVWLDDFSLTEN